LERTRREENGNIKIKQWRTGRCDILSAIMSSMQDVNQVVIEEETTVEVTVVSLIYWENILELILTVCWQHPRGSY